MAGADNNNPMSMLVNHSMQKKHRPQDEHNQKKYSNASFRKTIINNEKKQQFNALDDLMQELYDISQQYDDQLTMKGKSIESKDNVSRHSKNNSSAGNQDKKPPMTLDSDSKYRSLHSTSEFSIMQQSRSSATSNRVWVTSDSIERLRQRQIELQSQLDGVEQAAKALELRQKRKLERISEDDHDESLETGMSGQTNDDGDDDEDELLEFQQIENELRISDLKRQLASITEEITIRLYEQLDSRCKPHQQNHQAVQQQQQLGCPSSHTDNPSTASSSCSDELTTTSTSDVSHSATDKVFEHGKCSNSQQLISNHQLRDSFNEFDGQEGTTKQQHEDFKAQGSGSQKDIARTVNANDEFLSNYNFDQTNSGGVSKNSSTSSTTPTNNNSDLDSALDNSRSNEIMTPTTSKESLGSSEKRTSPSDSTNIYSNFNTLYNPQQHINSQSYYPSFMHTNPTIPICPSNGAYRNNSVNSDLERIEEDEEDCQDQYCDSNHQSAKHFRTIYEEKLSPIIYGRERLVSKQQHDNIDAFKLSRSNQPSETIKIENVYLKSCHRGAQGDHYFSDHQQSSQQTVHDNQQYNPSTETSFDRSVELNNSNNNSFSASGCSGSSTSSCKRDTMSTKATSRPLTLYLPRPDEEIDLVEHIQALGHDLNIISNDLKLNSTSAHGYLWKSCSNNNKKWLKRYFYFDRNLKVLSYYENENQLVKKHSKPRNSIRFEEISDVYVDHKLSGIGEKDRSSKRKNYVFVLATVGRKYLLASSRVETMRAWIDMLFTAAKANDYFQQLSAIEDDAGDVDGEEDGWTEIRMRNMVISNDNNGSACIETN